VDAAVAYARGVARFIAIAAGGFGCVGALILILGVIWFPSARALRRERAFIAAYPLRSCGDVTRDPCWGNLSAVEGHTAPGPAGRLTAPLSGRPAVWYHVVAKRVMSRSTTQGPVETWYEPLWEATVGEPFALVDATGQVEVSARLVDANSTYVSVRGETIIEDSAGERTRREDQLGPYLRGLIAAGVVDPQQTLFRGYLDHIMIKERLIPPDRHLFVLAAPQPRNGCPVLSPVPRGYTAISTHTRDVVTGRQPRPGTRGDAPAGCGFALLVVGAVMVIVGIVVAILAIRPH
jgi:hypothetical protein